MARNVLIIGANGFIGKHVVNEFLKNSQYNITAADLPGTFKQRYAFQTIEADITMPESLEEVIKKKDIIINVSGLVDLSADKKKLFDVNVNGVKNLCELCKRKDVEKLIHLSSIGVYGKVKNEAVTEYSRKRPKNNYEQSKYYGELVAFSYSNYFKVLAIRPAAVYGIGSLHKNVLPLFNILKHKNIYSFKAGPRLSHVHVEDVARAVLFLAENKNAHGAYNLADDVPINTKELVSTLLEPLGLTVKPIIPYSKSLVLLLKYFAQSRP